MPINSDWVKPIRLKYTQDGREKIWDTLSAENSVNVIIFNVSRKKLVLVKQFRPPIYCSHVPNGGKIDVAKYPASLGVTLELCGGLVDKQKSIVEIAKDEVQEECGYEAPVSAFVHVVTLSNISVHCAKQSVFYVEVTDDMLVHQGGGLECEGELIEIVEMSAQEVKDYVNSKEVSSPASFLFGVMWFLMNKADRY